MAFLGVVASKANSSAGSSDSTTALINVPAGSFLVAVLLIASATPTFTSFSCAGNSFSVAKQDITTNEIVIGYSAQTTAAVTAGSSTAGWALSASASQADFVVLAFDEPVTLTATPTLTQESGSASYSQSVSALAGETVVWVFGAFAAVTQAAKTGDGGVATSVNSTSRALALGYYADLPANATLTQTINWGTTPTCVHTAVRFTPSGGTAPTANAGTDQSVTAGDVVQLDASGSTGVNLTYAWTHVSGPSSVAALSDPSIAKPTYVPATSGTDVWQVAVTNSGGTSTDTVSITAANRKPVAVVGGAQTVAVGQTVTLDGSGSYDPDTGDTITYAWTLTSGVNSGLSDATAASPTYVASNGGVDTWQLVVTDNHSQASDPVSVTVTVGASGVRIRVSGQWVEALCKQRISGAWVQI